MSDDWDCVDQDSEQETLTPAEAAHDKWVRAHEWDDQDSPIERLSIETHIQLLLDLRAGRVAA